MKTQTHVMTSALAGRWYSADAEALTREIDGYLEQAAAPVDPTIRAVIVPHAGYVYSAPVAAAALARLDQGSIRRVVAMGPSHHAPLQNQISIPTATHIRTPLGEVPLDRAALEALQRSPRCVTLAAAHEGEHSVQIQLPLLQRALPEGFELVPIVVGQLDVETMRAVAEDIRPLLDEHTLVLASTDFTHHGPNFQYVPFRGDDVQPRIKALDHRVFKHVQQVDLDAFAQVLDETQATVCGRCPVGVLLALLAPDAAVEEVAYDTSGRQTADETHSVSYLSAVIRTTWAPTNPETGGEGAAGRLTPAEQKALLRLARETMERVVRGGKEPSPKSLGIELTAGLKQHMGGFVTLKHGDQLRGCIGEILPRRPIWEVVSEQTVNAALHDSRFRPVQPEESAGLTVEISAMTPPEPIPSWRDFEVGRHGIILAKQGRRAVFLPQVAPEQGWGAEETLTHLALKAGLSAESWRQGAHFEVFEAQVFHEAR